MQAARVHGLLMVALPAFLRSASRRRVFLVGGSLVFTGLIVVTAAAILANLRERALAGVENELSRRSLIFGAQANLSLQTLSQVMASIADYVAYEDIADEADFRVQLASEDVHRLLKDRITGDQQIAAIGFFGTDGKLVNTSRMWPPPDKAIPDPEHLEAVVTGKAVGLHVSPPFINNDTGVWNLAIAQPLTNADGQVVGHLAGVIKLSYFENYWRIAIDSTEVDSSVSLVRDDGTVLARYPASTAIGKTADGGPHDRFNGAAAMVGRKVSPDGTRRVEAARVLDNYPLFIVTTETEQTALRGWVRTAQMVTAIVVCVIMVVLLAAGGLWRWADERDRRNRVEAERNELENSRLVAEAELRNGRESEIQRERLHAAIDNMTQGLVMFDADERLVVVNNRFVRMYNLPPGVMVPGRTFKDVLSHLNEIGQLLNPPEQYYERVKAALASGEASQRFVTSNDGREIFVVNRPIPGGGWLGTHEDITVLRRHELALQYALKESQETRQQLDAAVNNMTQGLLMYDAHDRLVVVNARFLSMYSLSSDVVKPGLKLEDLIAYRAAIGQINGDPAAFCAGIRARRARGEFNFLQDGPDGRIIAVVTRPMTGGGWVVTHEDVTRLRTHEAALQKALAESHETQMRLDAALNTMSQGLVMCDAEANVVVVNSEYVRMYNLSPEDIKPGMSLGDLFRLRMASGNLPLPVHYDGTTEDYISYVLGKIDPDRTYESTTTLRDGRQVVVTNRPMAQGGWVATHQDVTTLLQNERKIQEALEKSREAHVRLDAAINNMSQGLVMCDAEGRVVVVNNKYIEMYGLSPDVVKPGCTFPELMEHRAATGGLAADPQAYSDSVMARVARDRSFDMQARTPAGREIMIHNRPVPGGGWLATHQDITDQKQAARQLDETRHFLDTIIENAPIAIVVKDATTLRVVLVNRAYEELIGRDQSELVGKTAHDIYEPTRASYIMRVDRERIDSALGRTRNELLLVTADGKHRDVASTSFVVRDIEGKPQYLIVAIEDITERKITEARIAHMAHHDALTNLPNRVLLHDRLKDMLSACSAEAPLAVLYLDLDHFKRVNDTLGHLVGNELLKVVAERLRNCLGENDFVARLSGDEFLIVHTGARTSAEAAAFAQTVREEVAAPISLDGNQIFADLSIGIALAPEHGTDSAQLMKYADMALYAAKSDGRGTFCFFEPAMSARMNARRELELDLRKAIKNGELELYYQPLVSLESDKIGGFEALMRWQHPQRGAIAPAEFIPVAEETGLIGAIGDWALRTACFEAAHWPNEAKVAVNVSPVQFKNSNLSFNVAGILAASGLSPRRLEIEITEAVLMDDSDTTRETLHLLHDLGVRIAMDDFGTGYSSLSYLRSFPFDKIKIDRSFISDLCENEDSIAIVRSIASLANSLNITTTAEGVENEAQLEWVRLLGCTEAQGYLFGRPKRGADLADYFKEGDGRSRSAA